MHDFIVKAQCLKCQYKLVPKIKAPRSYVPIVNENMFQLLWHKLYGYILTKLTIFILTQTMVTTRELCYYSCTSYSNFVGYRWMQFNGRDCKSLAIFGFGSL